jgi:hypothetical protein
MQAASRLSFSNTQPGRKWKVLDYSAGATAACATEKGREGRGVRGRLMCHRSPDIYILVMVCSDLAKEKTIFFLNLHIPSFELVDLEHVTPVR